MSAEPTLVTARHMAYIAERCAGDDDFLVRLKQAAEAAGIPPIWIGPAQAAFQALLLRLHGARQVVEVGTLAGYAAVAMARALPADGRLRTIELDPAHAAFAREWIGRSDVAERVEVLEGSGRDVLATLEPASLDALFLDADKAGYVHYLERGLELLRPGGLLLADNAFAFGQLFDEEPTDPEAPAVIAFNEVLAACDELEAVLVPVGDGLWVARRR